MKLVIMPAARSDILRQIDYYVDLRESGIGDRFMSAVQSSINSLASTPLAGSPKYFNHPQLQGLRSWTVNEFRDFRIYYLLREDMLTVVRILHSRRDIEELFGKMSDLDH